MQHANALLHIHEIDWLAPLTRQVLLQALQEATDQRCSYAYPEHVLLGLLTQEQSTVTQLLSSRGVSATELRQRLKALLSRDNSLRPGSSPLFSADVLDYIRRAVLFLTADHPQLSSSRQVTPELLTLSFFSHPVIQKLLAPHATNIIQLRHDMLEELELDSVRQMDRRFLFSRHSSKEEYPLLHIISLHQGRGRRILSCIEPPHFHLQDVVHAQQHHRSLPVLCPELQAFLAFLQNPLHTPLSSRGMIFVEQSDLSSRQMLRAVAGEADAPFATVFGSVIAEIWEQSDVDVQVAQNQMREAFIALRMLSTGLVFLEDLDLLLPQHGPQSGDRRKVQLWQYLLIELDKLLLQPNIALVAATCHSNQVPSELLRLDRFGHRIVDKLILSHQPPSSEKHAAHSAGRFCRVCRRAAKDQWDFCIYCGSPLKRACSSCGSPYPDSQDAKFCAHCGQALT